jgi:transcriptional regulator with XRE-family HTH domain
MDRFAKRVQQYKRENNLTFKEMSERIGVSHGAVGSWARGNYAPDRATLEVVSKFFQEPVWKMAEEAWGWPDPCAEPVEVPALPPEYKDIEVKLGKLAALNGDSLKLVEALVNAQLASQGVDTGPQMDDKRQPRPNRRKKKAR